jgi:hypothetical protein
MDKKDFKMLMYALYGNKQLIIPDGQTLHQWIDNAFIEKKEQLHIPDVSQQRELLIDFCTKLELKAKQYSYLIPDEDFIDEYLKDN